MQAVSFKRHRLGKGLASLPMNRLKAGELFKTTDDQIDISRIKLHRIGRAASFLGSNDGRPRTREGIDYYIATFRDVDQGVRHKLYGLGCWMIGGFGIGRGAALIGAGIRPHVGAVTTVLAQLDVVQ